LLPIAMKYGRILGALPFVRMVALTGSLAVMNVSKTDDFDYMLVRAKGRVWTARAFAPIQPLRAPVRSYDLPEPDCLRNALEWQLHDLYSARELYQMIPMTGLAVYQKLMEANPGPGILPNALFGSQQLAVGASLRFSVLAKTYGTSPARQTWRSLRAWEMKRKIVRFSKQAGFGEETVFNPDVCQGNFHHHRKWTREVFQQRKMKTLAVILPLSLRE
jgi:hypothetical protein